LTKHSVIIKRITLIGFTFKGKLFCAGSSNYISDPLQVAQETISPKCCIELV